MSTKTENYYAIFFLNTGRCGSQFFASKLAQHYGDIARVEHEPHQEHYRPPLYFSMLNRRENIKISDNLREHFDSIDETLQTMHYIETGWPVYGILPYLIERYKEKIKIVHLFRHPVNVAASLTTHNVYSRGEWSDKMSIKPDDFGVAQDYLSGDQWIKMDEFCKCIFWWTEINRFALDLKKKNATTPWLPLKFEEVFSCDNIDTLRMLPEFMEFPVRGEFLKSTREKVDRHQYVKDYHFDVRQIENYAETIKVMNELDYTRDEISEGEIRKRYQVTFNKRIKNSVTSLIWRWRQRLQRATC